MPYTVGMVSLGCPKNQVDAEGMLARLEQAGFEIRGSEFDIDCVIVNTCGFIEDAKKEAIENILELAELKRDGTLKALVVTGCLAERYQQEIQKEMPEVDAVVGIGSNADIAQIVREAIEGKGGEYFGSKMDLPLEGERILTTPNYTAYLKIAEGCSNCCTYCTIPKIRGPFRSRPMESCIQEAEWLASRGVKEVVVVAQDVTNYGIDLYGESKLADLLEALSRIDGIEWIRTLYTYPERIDDRLIQTVARSSKILHYFDIPLQHCNADILRRMNRKGDEEQYLQLIAKLRAVMPDVILRTTFITGFPGESEEQFEQLCNFVKKAQFDRVGCFAYSAEEDTIAAAMPDQVDEQVKVRRSEIIMDIQNRIVNEKNTAFLGCTIQVLVEGYDNYIKCCYGRSRGDAPEIDAKVFFRPADPRPQVGDLVDVEITDTVEYDLLGQQLDKGETL